jgi:hypothetical protein
VQSVVGPPADIVGVAGSEFTVAITAVLDAEIHPVAELRVCA